DTTIDIYELISKLQLDGVYDLYIIVKVPEYQFGDKRKRTLEETAEKSTKELGEKCHIYPIRLGRFSHTDVFGRTPGVTPDGNSYNFYKTIKGNISLAINHEVSQKRKMQIDHLYSKGHELEFGGKLFTRNSEIEDISLIIKPRESSEETSVPVELSWLVDDVKNRFGLNRYWYEAKVDLNQIFQNDSFNDDVYDLFFELTLHDYSEKIRMRIGKPRFRAR